MLMAEQPRKRPRIWTSVLGSPPWQDELIPQLNANIGRMSLLNETIGGIEPASSPKRGGQATAPSSVAPDELPLEELVPVSGLPPDDLLEHDAPSTAELKTPIRAKRDTT